MQLANHTVYGLKQKNPRLWGSFLVTLVLLNSWEKQKDTVKFNALPDSYECGNIFCSWLTSGQNKNVFIDIWNDAFKTVQGQISELSVSSCGSQSLKKLNSYFQFIKSISCGGTDDQIFQRSAADMLIFPWKSSLDCGSWKMLVTVRSLQHAPAEASRQNSVWGIFTCCVAV